MEKQYEVVVVGAGILQGCQLLLQPPKVAVEF